MTEELKTKRELIAAIALHALMSRYVFDNTPHSNETLAKLMARDAVFSADALLEELAKEQT